jgi:hypothetical protein
VIRRDLETRLIRLKLQEGRFQGWIVVAKAVNGLTVVFADRDTVADAKFRNKHHSLVSDVDEAVAWEAGSNRRANALVERGIKAFAGGAHARLNQEAFSIGAVEGTRIKASIRIRIVLAGLFQGNRAARSTATSCVALTVVDAKLAIEASVLRAETDIPLSTKALGALACSRILAHVWVVAL